LLDGSGVNREVPASFCERLEVKVLRSTRHSCHYIPDWNYDEDRCRIRTGHGPANITRLRRFAIGLIKFKGVYSVAQKMRELTRHVRLVFDYLRMSKNSCVPVALIVQRQNKFALAVR